MNIPTEYITGNKKYDQKIALALSKESHTKPISLPKLFLDTNPPLLPPTQYTFTVIAMGKPRMTQRDKWMKRDVTNRYWLYKDELVRQARELEFDEQIVLSNYYHLVFYLPMPKSWSTKKKQEMNGLLHRDKPDKDNLEKAFLDCLCKDDSFVADSRVTKYWAYREKARIEVRR